MVREYEARMCSAVFPHDWSRGSRVDFVRARLTAGECTMLYTFVGIGRIAGRRLVYVRAHDGAEQELTMCAFRDTFGVSAERCGVGFKLVKRS